jgi:hypothetical protein
MSFHSVPSHFIRSTSVSPLPVHHIVFYPI